MEEKGKGGFSRQAETALYRLAKAGCPESLDRLLRMYEWSERAAQAYLRQRGGRRRRERG